MRRWVWVCVLGCQVEAGGPASWTDGGSDDKTSRDGGDGQPDMGAKPRPPEKLVVESHLPAERAYQIVNDCPDSRAYEVRVLSLRYFPVIGEQLDSAETGFSSSLADIRARIDQLNKQLEQALEIGSTFRPLTDASASCSLQYTIIDDIEHLEALPAAPPGPPNHADYNLVLDRESICDLVETQHVKEVWLWGYHTASIWPVESNMAGPWGDTSNSWQVPDDMPICARTYTLYNYNYSRGLGEAIENHGHQIEFMGRHLDAPLFDGTFSQPFGQYGGVRNGCGDVHRPPNTWADYDWSNTGSVMSDCLDWNPQRTGALTPVTCALWGCDGDGGARYKIWWMTYIPGKASGLSTTAGPLRNWWEMVGDWDAVMESGGGLVEP